MSANTFTDEQIEAIRRRGAAFALAANAGSGKTSVLVERFVRDVTEDAITPSRILAITFTERAAGELRTRIRRGLLARGEHDAAHDSGAGFISTFHGFCARILRAHPLLTGLAPGFVVLADTETVALRERAFSLAFADWLSRDSALDLAAAFDVEPLRTSIFEVFDEQRSRGEPAPHLPAPLPRGDPDAARARLAAACGAIAAELSAAKPIATVNAALATLEQCGELLDRGAEPSLSQLVDARLSGFAAALNSPAAEAYEQARSDCEEAVGDALGAAAVALLDDLLRRFGERFAAAKRARGAADFDDLELAAAALLRDHEDVARLWRERFERLMVDELQDTNARQMSILTLLDRDNLFTVGDEFQSIYAFRHADVEIFRERFATLYDREQARVLSSNFRSRTALLDGVNAVFGPLFGPHFVPLAPGREDAAGGSPIELLVTASEGWEGHEQLLGAELAPAPLWRRAEARLLAQRIGELIDAGDAAPGEIVVLLRAATDIGVYEAAIADLGLATVAGAGEGFYERPEVGDLAAYVQALANPLDELALIGVLASPLCGASADALVALTLCARESQRAIWECLLEETAEGPLASFGTRFALARRAAQDAPLGEIVTSAVREHGYDRYLCQLHSPERRLANVHKLVRLARDFERREGRDLRRFADALNAGLLGALREPQAPPPLADAIRLMTIHAAKGLEFPVVCLADLGRGPNHGQPRLLTDGQRVGLRLPTPERDNIPTLDYVDLVEARKRAKAAEEQRIFYVAMTRAQERLILSGAARFDNWPGVEQSALAWLGPALVPDLRSRAALGGAGPAVVSGAAGVAVRLTLSTPEEVGVVLSTSARSRADDAALAAAIVVPTAPMRPPSAPDVGRLSYTALAEYERCAYRYYLQRVVGLGDVEAPGEGSEPGIGAAARGVVVHALLEQLDFGDPRPLDRQTIEAAAIRAGVALSLPADVAEIGALAEAFVRSPLHDRLARCRELRREQPFAFALASGELLRGFIDIAGVEDDGTLLIVDYKTDWLSENEDLAAHIERDYSLQRLTYALAGLHGGAPRVEVAHCFLRAPAQPVTAAYAAADRERLEVSLGERVEPLRTGHFAVTADPGRARCASCPGRARLCSYDESLTLRVTAF